MGCCIPITVTPASRAVLPVKKLWKTLRGAVRNTEMKLFPLNIFDIVASFADAVVKCPMKSKLREKRFILVVVQEQSQSIMTGSPDGRRLKQLVMLYPPSGSRE